ncbi:50S ribosomal protein L3 [Candidatus Daviesbacteria bacterium]|nr:50S ribosomal protein L3 [Candidatus Daviesbacteria bacterium]
MTSTYDSRGRRVGATVITLGPNFVTQLKTTDTKDGYSAVQIGFGIIRPSSGGKKSVNKAQIGHTKKAGVEMSLRFLKEVRVETVDVNPGQEIKVSDIFFIGDAVKVSGTTKGKGFQGGVKRYRFHGGPKTHGQSDRHRAPGSIGSGTTPGRVFKGKKMAGHMGNSNLSYTGLEVVGVDKENNTPPPEEKVDEEEEAKEAEGAKTEGADEVKEAEAPKEGEENAS